MTLSSDELGILEYLKGWHGKFVPVVEICRRAGGRRKYEDSPHWARPLMGRLVEAQLVQVNDRGHYRALLPEKPKPDCLPPESLKDTPPIVAENYFPSAPAATEPTEPQAELLVDENYFPPVEVEQADAQPERWMSPQIAEILRKSGNKVDPKHTDS